MSNSQKASRVPRAKKDIQKQNSTKDSDHSYVKQTRQAQKGKYKPTYSPNVDDDSDINSDDSVSMLNDESAPCYGCQKTLSKSVNGVCCSFCEHWFCLKCSKLKKMVYQALNESPDSLMWFCTNCLTSFPGVKKIMIRMGSLEDKYDKLESRVESLEKQPNSVENVEDIVRQEVKELRDIDSRRLQMVCFNLTESESDESGQRREDDEIKLKDIIDNDMTLQDKNIDVENLV